MTIPTKEGRLILITRETSKNLTMRIEREDRGSLEDVQLGNLRKSTWSDHSEPLLEL